VSGFAGSARTDTQVRDHLRAAFAAMRNARPRPAYVDIPLDLLAEPTALRPETFVRASPAPAAPHPALEEARTLLAAAQRPLVIAGGGARGAGAALRQLVEDLDAYLVTTVAGKGIVAESHPASLGASLPYALTQERVAEADVVLAAGTELSETDIYTTTRLGIRGRLIRLDVDEHKLADHYAAGVALRGDAAASLQLLAQGIRARRGWRSAAGDGRAHRARIEAQFGGGRRAALAALRALRESLPADGVIFSDMTQIAYLGNYAFGAERPGVWFHPSGYGALGYALPAALGARIAQPQRAIAALAGDFGVQFTLQELMTAVELDLTLPIIVWNNGALGQIRADMRAAGIAPIGVVARNPDFVALAHACGAAGVRVHGAPALAAELRAALERPGPTLLEAVAGDFRMP
jgi:5-guanidino-2-oxopentanoate decarboxylase